MRFLLAVVFAIVCQTLCSAAAPTIIFVLGTIAIPDRLTVTCGNTNDEVTMWGDCRTKIYVEVKSEGITYSSEWDTTGGSSSLALYAYLNGGHDSFYYERLSSSYEGHPNFFVWGGNGDDAIGTGDKNDEAYGEAGNDWMFTNGGDDILYGGTGDDTGFSGLGFDWANGGPTDPPGYNWLDQGGYWDYYRSYWYHVENPSP
jgi:Ca2+-binding RTX toxin-like protein